MGWRHVNSSLTKMQVEASKTYSSKCVAHWGCKNTIHFYSVRITVPANWNPFISSQFVARLVRFKSERPNVLYVFVLGTVLEKHGNGEMRGCEGAKLSAVIQYACGANGKYHTQVCYLLGTREYLKGILARFNNHYCWVNLTKLHSSWGGGRSRGKNVLNCFVFKCYHITATAISKSDLL